MINCLATSARLSKTSWPYKSANKRLIRCSNSERNGALAPNVSPTRRRMPFCLSRLYHLFLLFRNLTPITHWRLSIILILSNLCMQFVIRYCDYVAHNHKTHPSPSTPPFFPFWCCSFFRSQDVVAGLVAGAPTDSSRQFLAVFNDDGAIRHSFEMLRAHPFLCTAVPGQSSSSIPDMRLLRNLWVSSVTCPLKWT